MTCCNHWAGSGKRVCHSPPKRLPCGNMHTNMNESDWQGIKIYWFLFLRVYSNYCFVISVWNYTRSFTHIWIIPETLLTYSTLLTSVSFGFCYCLGLRQETSPDTANSSGPPTPPHCGYHPFAFTITTSSTLSIHYTFLVCMQTHTLYVRVWSRLHLWTNLHLYKHLYLPLYSHTDDCTMSLVLMNITLVLGQAAYKSLQCTEPAKRMSDVRIYVCMFVCVWFVFAFIVSCIHCLFFLAMCTLYCICGGKQSASTDHPINDGHCAQTSANGAPESILTNDWSAIDQLVLFLSACKLGSKLQPSDLKCKQSREGLVMLGECSWHAAPVLLLQK